MILKDLYHRAFNAFRDHTRKDTESQNLRNVLAHAKNQNDLLTSIKYECTIESDWIENIEEGLIYVEKAINEERQFIRTEGEVVPIEKVKGVSKASVEHLARHSNLITRIPKIKTDTLIPDELYVVEKLNDYQVYENRFLYLLLSYLRDFIQMRLVKIKDKTTSYQSHMEINKTLNKDQRHLEFELSASDLIKNDELLIEEYHKIPLVDRVENIYALVISFLNTSLMKEVAKAPMIKPPVVKTNVLRMNQNFRAALTLYDYVTSYNKDGYTFHEKKITFSPFPEVMGDEIADGIQLFFNIAYIEGNDLREPLAKKYEAFLRNQKEKEAKRFNKELKRLKKRIVEMGEDPSEYILKLEKRNAQLEKVSTELAYEKEKNVELSQTVDTLKEEKTELKKEISNLNKQLAEKTSEIDALNQKYFDDMNDAEALHQKEMNSLNEKYQRQIETMIKNHEEEVQALNEAHDEEVRTLKATYEEEISTLKEAHAFELQRLKEAYKTKEETLIKSYEEKLSVLKVNHEEEKQALIDKHEEETKALNTHITQLDETIDTLEKEKDQLVFDHQKTTEAQQRTIDELETTIKRLKDEKKYEKSRYLALKKQQGLITEKDNLSSKERFKQLEAEREAYKKLFKEEWKKAKRQIREEAKNDILYD